MNKFSKVSKVILLGSVVFLLAAGCNKVTTPAVDKSAPAASQQQSSTKSDVISYQGQEGKTALDILKATHQVETQNFSGVGEFVKSIDGVAPDKDHFWGFYVNGQSSNVGAGQYQSKSSDKIEWKLDAVGDYKE